MKEIADLEEKLRQAELGPDPAFFEQYLDDDALIDGQKLKSRVVEAHRPTSKAPKFTSVKMSDFEFHDHGEAVVVKCRGDYESPQWSGTMISMRVWLKKRGEWKIIAASTLKQT